MSVLCRSKKMRENMNNNKIQRDIIASGNIGMF